MRKIDRHWTMLLLVFGTVTVTTADWPQWRGPQRTGYIDASPLIRHLPEGGLEPSWQFDDLEGGSSGGWSSPVIADGYVYLYSHTKTKTGDLGSKEYPYLSPEDRTGMTDEEYEAYEVKRRAEDRQRSVAFDYRQRLVCLDLTTGDLVWEKQFAGDYTRFVQSATPCVQGQHIYLLGSGRVAYCFDRQDGTVVWQTQLPGEFDDEFYGSSFAVANDIAVVACGPLFAMNADDGSIRWSSDEPKDFQSHSSPVIWKARSASVVINNTAGGRTRGFRLEDGRELWELGTGVGRSSPVVVGNRLLAYGTSRKNGLIAYALVPEAIDQQPEEVWRFRGAADSGSTPVVRKDHVFVQGEKRLAKVTLEDGSREWQHTMNISNPRYTSPIGIGDQVIFAWEGILAFDATTDDYHELYQAKIDRQGHLWNSEELRGELGVDEGGADAKAEKVWQREAIRTGPLRCATPAFADGRLVIRREDGVVCFDLRRDLQAAAASSTVK